MVKKQVTIANIKTLADHTPRVCVDLLSGDENDMKEMYKLMKAETIMILCKEEEYVDTVMALAKELADKIKE